MFTRSVRALLIGSAAILSLVLGACGGGGGPDTGDAKEKLLQSVNLSAEGKARFVEFKETDRKLEKAGDMEGCVVSFEGEMEFTGDCEYEMAARKKGDRLKFEATVEYLNDGSGWKQMGPMGLYPR